MNRKQKRREDESYVLIVPRQLGWCAPRYRCSLRYHGNITINNAGFTAANVRYIPTFAYDVDPTVGSTAMPGFTELGTLYRVYRVNGAQISCSFSNREAFPVEVYVSAVNSDPGANYSVGTAQTYCAQRTSKSMEIGPLTGNGIGTLKDRQLTSRFGGAVNTLTTDFYVGTTGGTAPSNNWYWTVGVISVPSNLSAGVQLRVVMDIDLEFFEVSAPAS
jgi:hypothetical protein